MWKADETRWITCVQTNLLIKEAHIRQRDERPEVITWNYNKELTGTEFTHFNIKKLLGENI